MVWRGLYCAHVQINAFVTSVMPKQQGTCSGPAFHILLLLIGVNGITAIADGASPILISNYVSMDTMTRDYKH